MSQRSGSPICSTASSTARVTPRIVRSPITSHRSRRAGLPGSTRVPRNVMVGYVATSKKSAEHRCSSRFLMPVSIEAASIRTSILRSVAGAGRFPLACFDNAPTRPWAHRGNSSIGEPTWRVEA